MRETILIYEGSFIFISSLVSRANERIDRWKREECMILASIFIRFAILKFRLAHCNRVIGVVIQGIGEEEKEEEECLVSQNSQQTRFSNGEMIDAARDLYCCSKIGGVVFVYFNFI